MNASGLLSLSEDQIAQILVQQRQRLAELAMQGDEFDGKDWSLIQALKSGDLAMVRSLSEETPGMLEKLRDEFDNDALTIAAQNGHLEIVVFLIEEKRVSVENRGYIGRTALVQAASRGHLEVVKFLVEKAGANLRATDDKLKSMAIHLAAENGHVPVVEYLLTKDPQLLEGARQVTGDTALHRAAFGGKLETVRFFVEQAKANVEGRGFMGRTALIMAAAEGHMEVVKLLTEQAHADIKATDEVSHGMAIHAAAEFGHFDVVKYLVGRDRSLVDGAKLASGDTALNRAAFGGHLEIVKFLVNECMANVENRGERGATPIIQAASEGHLPVIKFLVEKGGANIEAKDLSPDEDSAIHLAAYFGYKEVVEFILDNNKNAVLHLRNKHGQTALDYAKQENQMDVANLLLSHGAVVS